MSVNEVLFLPARQGWRRAMKAADEETSGVGCSRAPSMLMEIPRRPWEPHRLAVSGTEVCAASTGLEYLLCALVMLALRDTAVSRRGKPCPLVSLPQEPGNPWGDRQAKNQCYRMFGNGAEVGGPGAAGARVAISPEHRTHVLPPPWGSPSPKTWQLPAPPWPGTHAAKSGSLSRKNTSTSYLITCLIKFNGLVIPIK